MDVRVIADRYQLLEQLGQGGFATVFKAWHTTLHKLVAIKLLHEAYSQDPSFRRRFENEARAAAGLTDPHIVDIHDCFSADGQLCIVMEYMPRTLMDYLKENPPLSEQDSRGIITQILQGLATAHSAGRIHRDMKPQNVLMTPHGQLKIADFGIAKLLGEAGGTVKTVGPLGTPHYMSPEQVNPEIGLVTPQSDLYAVGIMLYEMLSDRLPFEGDSLAAVMVARLTQQPRSLREVAPNVSDGMVAIVEKAMARGPANRFHDANDMLQALDALPAPKKLPKPPGKRAAQERYRTAVTTAWSSHHLDAEAVDCFKDQAASLGLSAAEAATVERKVLGGKTKEELRDAQERYRVAVTTEWSGPGRRLDPDGTAWLKAEAVARLKATASAQGLSAETAAAVERDVLGSKTKEELLGGKLRDAQERYRAAVTTVRSGQYLKPEAVARLKDEATTLGLSADSAAAVERDVLGGKTKEELLAAQERYHAAVTTAWSSHHLDAEAVARLKDAATTRGLSTAEAATVERKVLGGQTKEELLAAQERYRAAVATARSGQYLKPEAVDHLKDEATTLGLSAETAAAVERRVLGGQTKEELLAAQERYRAAVTAEWSGPGRWLGRDGTVWLKPEAVGRLKAAATAQGLSAETTAAVERAVLGGQTKEELQKRPPRSRLRPYAYATAAVLALGACGILIWKLVPQPTQPPMVSTLYAATVDSVKRSANGDYLRPRRVSTFYDNTVSRGIAFYFALKDVAAPRPFKITVRDDRDPHITATQVSSDARAEGGYIALLPAPRAGTYPAGINHVDLLINSKKVTGGSTSFTLILPRISTFYLTTKAAYDVWRSQTAGPPPQKVDTFPATTSVLAYFDYKGATTASTYQVHFRDHGGTLVATVGPHTLGPPPDGPGGGAVPPSHGGGYSRDHYRADLLIDGQVVTSTSVIVTSTVAMPTISRFYTGTRKAYEDWAKTNYAPLPRVSTFPIHTRDVAYYFEHAGGGTGITPIQAYIRNQRGVIVASGIGRRPFNLSETKYAGYVPAPRAGGYPAGTYTLALLIHGQVAGSTTFTVQPPPPTATPTPQPPTPTATTTPTATPQPSPTPTVFASTATPADVLRSFYNAINRREFKRAYGYWAETNGHTLRQFASGYADTVSDRIVKLIPAPYLRTADFHAWTCVGLQFLARLKNGRTVDYGGWYVVERATGPHAPSNGWRILGRGTQIRKDSVAKVPPQARCGPAPQATPAAQPTPTATATPQPPTSTPTSTPPPPPTPTPTPQPPTPTATPTPQRPTPTATSTPPPPPPTATPIPHVTISAFYTSVDVAPAAWEDNTRLPPAKTVRFGTCRTAVGIYFAYQGATPNVTRFQWIIYASSGAVVQQSQPETLPYNAGAELTPSSVGRHVPYPVGSYTIDLLIDGKVAAGPFNFTIVPGGHCL